MIGRGRSRYAASILRKRALRSIVIFLAVLLALGSSVFALHAWNSQGGGAGADALKAWNNASYEVVYKSAQEHLEKKPLSVFWLSLRGFSAYQIAAAQINSQDVSLYINDCIFSLRKALLLGAGNNESRLNYVLGKAYFQKGPDFADLATSTLEKAKASGYKSADLQEYLGLSYASLHEYRKSIIAFTEALGDNPSDLLLLSIARSYIELGEYEQARAYLVRCAEKTKDSKVIAQSKILLGNTLLAVGDTVEAEKEYLSVIESDEQNAEAQFALGELYASLGDSVKARASWRKALRIDPTHGPARVRLSS